VPTFSQEKASTAEVNVSVSEKKSAASEEKLFPLDTSISNNEDEVSPVFPLGILKHKSVDTGNFMFWRLVHAML
jgi:TFIIF-interacting CTD phosphatase-like protein